MSEIWGLPATVSMLTSVGLAFKEFGISDCVISNHLVQFGLIAPSEGVVSEDITLMFATQRLLQNFKDSILDVVERLRMFHKGNSKSLFKLFQNWTRVAHWMRFRPSEDEKRVWGLLWVDGFKKVGNCG
jgi:hypothetical protein